MTSAAGQIIYTAFVPTLKMMICIGAGYVLSRAGLFTAQHAKGVSILSLNIGLPALVFGSMVTAFTPQNLVAFGPLLFVAVMYEVIGFVLAVFVRELLYVPSDFRWGILVMGALSNWANLPIAVVQTLGYDPPFDGAADVQLGVAYISIFVLVMTTSLFPCGLHRLCAWDQEEPSSVRLSRADTWRRRMDWWKRRHHRKDPVDSSATSQDLQPSEAARTLSEDVKDVEAAPPVASPTIPEVSFRRKIILFAKSFVTPVNIAIILGILCGVVPPLKALFVDVDGWTVTRIPNAPDGNPPLAFLTESITFIGGMFATLALILLGSSFARLRMPQKWRDEPLPAMVAMAVIKMIIIPVIGVFVIQALRHHTNMFPSDDRMRTYIPILTSGTPAAVNQLVLTQVYSKDGRADTLSSFLLLQYLLMPVLSTALAAVGLYVVEGG